MQQEVRGQRVESDGQGEKKHTVGYPKLVISAL